MSELCLSISSTKPQFSILFISCFLFFFSFILSHPLYFSYFIISFPQLRKIISFHSPLFISTPLLLFSFILCFNSIPTDFFESDKSNILLPAYYSVVQRLRLQSVNESEDFWCLEVFKVFKMVFLGHPFEFLDCKSVEGSESPILVATPVEFCKSAEGSESPNLVETPVEFWDCKSAEEGESSILVETPVEFLDCLSAEGSESSILESSCYDNGSSTAICDHYQYLSDKLGENSADMGSTWGTMEKKILENFSKELDVFENMTWSDTVEEKKTESKGTKFHKAKDWKRTLACKFYEERHNASDSSGEGMDLLWEKYEMDSIKNNEKRDYAKKKMKKKGELKSYPKEEEINEQLCCVQVLKFSAGKMNLGMGRANLVRISKAIKGFKWLHHVSKNNKKVHCGDRF